MSGARLALDLGWGHPRATAALVLEELTAFWPQALSLCPSVSLFPTSPRLPPPPPPPRGKHGFAASHLHSSPETQRLGRHAASVKTRSEPSTTCDRKERNSCITDSFPVTPAGSETFNTIFSQAPGVSRQPGLTAGVSPRPPHSPAANFRIQTNQKAQTLLSSFSCTPPSLLTPFPGSSRAVVPPTPETPRLPARTVPPGRASPDPGTQAPGCSWGRGALLVPGPVQGVRGVGSAWVGDR